MSLFRTIVFVSGLAGLVAGLGMTGMQYAGTVPLILKAEVYEGGALPPPLTPTTRRPGRPRPRTATTRRTTMTSGRRRTGSSAPPSRRSPMS